MRQAELAIGINTLSHFIHDDEDLETQVRRCMGQARRCLWFTTDDDDRFKISVGAVMDHHGVDSEVYDRLARSLRVCTTLAAMLSNVPVDLDRTVEMHDDTLPLLGWWAKRDEWKAPER